MNWHQGLTEERVFLEYMKRQKKAPATVIDVGANYGDYSNLADSILNVKKIYAIDAVPLCCSSMKERFNDRPHIKVLNLTLGATTKSATFHELKLVKDKTVMNAMSSVVARPVFQQDRLKVKAKQVELTPLDSLFSTPIDLLKIDAEGYDLEVLKGAKTLLRKNLINYIQFEYGAATKDAGLKLDDFIVFLKQFNYSVYSLDVNGFTKIDKFVDDFRWVNFFASLHPLP